MTKLLEKAFSQASKLSPEEQDALANWLLKELESETGWDKRFAESQDELCQMAAVAIAENRRGETKELNPEKS